MTRLVSVARATTLLFATLFSACDDDGSTISTLDGGTGADGSGLCAVTPDYGDVGTIGTSDSIAVRLNDTQGQAKSITYLAALNGDQDQVVIQLYRGFSVFTTGAIQPGTYPITGDELNYASCGVCVRIFADRALGGGRPLQDMMATGGTLVVTEVGTAGSGVFRAELQDASFEHVRIDSMSFESSPVNDGCVTEISHLAADVPMTSAP
jgi:hypothetical protein